MGKPLDMAALRATIEAAPAKGRAAIVHRDWLEQVEREIIEGRAARAQLAADVRIGRVCDEIRDGARA